MMGQPKGRSLLVEICVDDGTAERVIVASRDLYRRLDSQKGDQCYLCFLLHVTSLRTVHLWKRNVKRKTFGIDTQFCIYCVCFTNDIYLLVLTHHLQQWETSTQVHDGGARHTSIDRPVLL